jgi:hypothetical protein
MAPISGGLDRAESGEDQRVTLAAVNAISAMVAPVVLLSVGSLISNGLLTVYNSVNERVRMMTRERVDILTGPAGEKLEVASVPVMGRERLDEIKIQLPLILRRHRLTRLSVLTIYAGVGVLGLSIVVIAIAVVLDNETAGRVALGLVLTGTVASRPASGFPTKLVRSADSGLPGCPQHERDWRAVPGHCLASDLEASTLIEGHGTRIRSLQVGGQMAPVDLDEARPHQLTAEPAALQGTVHAEPRKVPVWISRVGRLHLTEDGEQVVMLVGRDGIGEHGGDGIAVYLSARGQPHRDGRVLAESVDGLRIERPPAEGGKESWEALQILVRVRVQPALDRISCERHNERGPDSPLITRLHGQQCLLAHDLHSMPARSGEQDLNETATTVRQGATPKRRFRRSNGIAGHDGPAWATKCHKLRL